MKGLFRNIHTGDQGFATENINSHVISGCSKLPKSLFKESFIVQIIIIIVVVVVVVVVVIINKYVFI